MKDCDASSAAASELPSPAWVHATNEVACGPRAAAFLAAVAKRGAPNEILHGPVGQVVLELLSFADLMSDAASICQAEPSSAAHADGVLQSLGVLGASLLHERFVRMAAVAGGVPDMWASSCRNAMGPAYAFPLLAALDVE